MGQSMRHSYIGLYWYMHIGIELRGNERLTESEQTNASSKLRPASVDTTALKYINNINICTIPI